MDNDNQKEIIQEGLKFLDQALTHFMEVQGCDKSPQIVKIIYGIIFMIEKIYGINK